MRYKGLEIDPSQLNKSYTLNDIPDSALSSYEDVVVRRPGDTNASYKQRIVSFLNTARQKVASNIASRIHNVDKQELKLTQYDPSPGTKYFQPRPAQSPDSIYLRTQSKSKAREYTTLDIETDDLGRPITVSALKTVFNRETGQFEIVDNFQRFYKASNHDMRNSSSVHALTTQKLNKLRGQQGTRGVRYGKSYDDKEAQALKAFLGDSVIVGHNIVDFDLPHLFKTPLGNQTIDTLTASRNQWSGRKNDLDSVFQRVFGKTMEQSGLPHHDSMSDVIATAMIAQKMAVMKGATGDAIRYVMTTPGTHIAPLDKMTGSQIIQGTYNEYSKIGRYLHMDGMSIDERMEIKKDKEGNTVLPSGFHYDSGSNIPDFDIMTVLKDLSESQMSVASQVLKASQATGEFAQEMSKNMQMSSFADIRKFRMEAARFSDRVDRERFIRAAGYGEHETQLIMRGTDDLYELNMKRKQEKARERFLPEMWAAERAGDKDLFSNLVSASRRSDMTPQDTWNYFKDLDEYKTQRKFEHIRDRAIARRERHGKLLPGDRETLMDANNLEELADAADKVDLRMQRVTGAFKAFSAIPMYNFERLQGVFKGEVSGIKGAAQGLVPDFLYRPFSRLTDASMNAFTNNYAGLNAGFKIANTAGMGLMGVGSGLLMSGLGTLPGLALMGVGGLTSVISQVVGNAKEAGITQWGEGIQNNLNTVGLIQEYVLTPFRLLKSAVDKVIKAFGVLSSLTLGLIKVMSNGLSSLIQMGNPLTGMTGVDYGDYIGSTSIDYASLLGKGTTNGIFNDMASRRMGLYTTGQLDTNRLVAASMIGVYDQMYGSSYTDEQDALKDAVNHLRSTTKGATEWQKKQTYVLANTVNPNLAQILQTMDTLGIDDFDKLKHPRGMWGYKEDTVDGYRKTFQRSQWEWQYAGTQRNISFQRIASTLWNGGAGTFGLSGRSIYNTANEIFKSIANALEDGNWDKVTDKLSAVWEKIKEGVSKLWSYIQKHFDKGSFLQAVKDGAIKFINIVNTVWDAVVDVIIDKTTALVSYLSTIRLDWGAMKDLFLWGKTDKRLITSINDYSFDTTNHRDNKSKEASDQAYDSYADVAEKFDTRFNRKNAWDVEAYDNFTTTRGARITAGIPRSDTVLYQEKKKDYILAHVKGVLQNGTPEEKAYMAQLLKEKYGTDFNFSSLSARSSEDFLDLLARVAQYPLQMSAAAGTHREFLNDDLVKLDKTNGTFHGVADALRGIRDEALPSTLSTVIDTIAGIGSTVVGTIQDPAMIKLEFKDDKGKIADAEISKSGKVKTRSYNGFVGIEGSDGVFNFQVSNSTRGAY